MTVARFRQVLEATDLQLDEAWIALSGAIGAPLDEVEWLAAIELIAAEVPTHTAEGIADHLFDHLGFRGNDRAYYDWRNSCVDRVLTTRVGIPITLSILMIEVGRRLDVPLVGVGMPAHFLVRDARRPDRYYDPFGGGTILDEAGVRSLFARVTDGQMAWQPAFLAPVVGQAIVVRMLNNLRSIFTATRDQLRLGVVMQLRSCVPQLAVAESTDIAAASAVFN